MTSALEFPGAERLTLPDTLHTPAIPALIAPELAAARAGGMQWYGDEGALEKWLPWVLEGHLEEAEAAKAKQGGSDADAELLQQQQTTQEQ